MVTLDTHKAVTRLQDASAPEPLARATVDVVEEGIAKGTEKLVTEDGLQKALYRGLLTFGLSMLAMNLAIAGAALAVAQWMFN